MVLMQFSAIMLLTLLTLKLLLLPRKVGESPLASKARWLMTAGIILLDIQFLLQYTLGLRAMRVTQAVLVNLRKKHSRYHGNIKPRQSFRLAGLCVFSVCE